MNPYPQRCWPLLYSYRKPTASITLPSPIYLSCFSKQLQGSLRFSHLTYLRSRWMRKKIYRYISASKADCWEPFYKLIDELRLCVTASTLRNSLKEATVDAKPSTSRHYHWKAQAWSPWQGIVKIWSLAGILYIDFRDRLINMAETCPFWPAHLL